MKYILNLVITIAILLFVSSCKKENKIIVKAEQTFKKEGTLDIYKDSTGVISLEIEIAEDEYERQTGLMHRSTLGEKQGMLFIFEDESPRYFYMKNTYIPLDIIFINNDHQIVSFSENAEPTNEATLPSNAPAKYVLEINGGLVERWGLKTGDSISYIKDE